MSPRNAVAPSSPALAPPATPVEFSKPQARRIAMAAQGFGGPVAGADGLASRARVLKAIDAVGIVQIDSVNVLTRSQYLPIFARVGNYDVALLDRLRDRAPRRLVETWAHEASLVPASTWPLLWSRMSSQRWQERVAAYEARHPGQLAQIRDVVAAAGPLTAREAEAVLEHQRTGDRDSWGWNWSSVKEGLEWLFRVGEISSAGRNNSFERRYAAAESVLGEHHQPAELVDDDARIAELVRISLRAVGIGSVHCIRDYFRLTAARVQPMLDDMVRSGTAVPARVRGWDRPLYLDPNARRPRSMHAEALLSPFDSLIWQRDRTEQLFDFRYRLEIYVPADKRVHGYYVLPFLFGTELVARVDLKHDRNAPGGALLVRKVTWDRPSAAAAEGLDRQLGLMAAWLGAATVRWE